MISMTGTQGDWNAMNGGRDDQGRAWTKGDVRAMVDHMDGVNAELTARGELVEGQGLAAPDTARTVRVRDGRREVTDGPAQRGPDLLAGYWVVDCASEERALEIAALVSVAPAPGGEPGGEPVEVRPVMEEGPDGC
ncbi:MULTISPECIES: YciI family protein [Streptomyces]|uniref:YciI family protein n=1 Tax=Streptomyces TaxID=1883 RepID=UPI001D1316B6|nr:MULTISPECIES: YciI family protein [Streptomyces]